MCSIIGFSWSSHEFLVTGLNAIFHRGPYDSGIFIDDLVSLDHKRLSVLDLSGRVKQPMAKLNYTIIFNGKIYSFNELTKGFSEYQFDTTSDTELVLYTYNKWKHDCLNKFNGIFLSRIYDHKNKELFLARDRFGVKSLYYLKKKYFFFCSEIKGKGLLHFLHKKEIYNERLVQFFNFRFTLGETTLLKNVSTFLPHHYIVSDLVKKNITKYYIYYSLKIQNEEKKPFSFYSKKLQKLTEMSVKRRMVSDVPVGCLLSGGISSIIATIAKKYSENLNKFSIGFDTTNELPYAKLVSDRINSNYFEFKIDKNNILDYFYGMVWHMDEPIGDSSFLPMFILSKEASKHNKVVLSIEGADEIFCGDYIPKLLYYGSFLKHFTFLASTMMY